MIETYQRYFINILFDVLFFLIEIQFRTKYEEHVRKSHLNLETKRNSEIMEQIAKS